MLIANGNDSSENTRKLINYWREIINRQFEAIERAKHDGGRPEDERIDYSKYCEELGGIYAAHESDLQLAKEFFQEAIKYNPNKLNLQLEIGEIEYLLDRFDEAEAAASKVLKSEPQNPWALRLLGECLLMSDKLEKGIIGFSKVYERDNTNFTALGILFRFLRQNGKLDEVKERLKSVEEKLGDTNEPGLSYCRGIYYFYRKNAPKALEEFQKASRNKLYKQSSLRHMIDIYLNPNQNVYYNAETKAFFQMTPQNLKSVEILLSEIDTKYFQEEHSVLNTYTKLSDPKEVTESIAYLDSFLQERPNFTPALLSLCVLKAKNKNIDRETLKLMSKRPWNPRWLEDSERASLHVADFLISTKKFDFADKELKKCYNRNKSSIKAMEMFGELYEKQNMYESAWKFYNRAWELTEKKDCWTGFRIANLYFKSENWVRSIAIGNHVSESTLILDPQN